MTNTRTQTPTIAWRGISGKTYVYQIFPLGTVLWAEPGNYVWARRDPSSGNYQALYAGEAVNLKTRVTDKHERYPCVRQHGGTHITARINRAGQQARLDEETDIRKRYQPPCNRQ